MPYLCGQAQLGQPIVWYVSLSLGLGLGITLGAGGSLGKYFASIKSPPQTPTAVAITSSNDILLPYSIGKDRKLSLLGILSILLTLR